MIRWILLLITITVSLTACGGKTAKMDKVKHELAKDGIISTYTDDVEGLPESATLLLDQKMNMKVTIKKSEKEAEQFISEISQDKLSWTEEQKNQYHINALVAGNVVFWFPNQEKQEDVLNKLQHTINRLKNSNKEF